MIYNYNFGDIDDQFSLLLLDSGDYDNVDNDVDDASDSEDNDGYIAYQLCPTFGQK